MQIHDTERELQRFQVRVAVGEVGASLKCGQPLGWNTNGVGLASRLSGVAAEASLQKIVPEHPEGVWFVAEHLAGDVLFSPDRHSLSPT